MTPTTRAAPLIACLVLLATSPAAQAGFVSFQIGPNNNPEVVYQPATGPGNHWQIGNGWGDDGDESPTEVPSNEPTLLGATFDLNDNLPETFSLQVGDTRSVAFGSIQLTEPDSGGGILASELDDLGVTAYLTFIQPDELSGTSPSSTIAIQGAVSDRHSDLQLIFNPVLVSFGNGGLFTIDLDDISLYNARDAATTVFAHITLDSAPVPLPASLILFGTGGLAFGVLGIVRRRRGDPAAA